MIHCSTGPSGTHSGGQVVKAIVRASARYGLTGRGDVNTYALFAELMRSLVAATGRVGCIVPTGIATDETTRFFFADVIQSARLQPCTTSRTGCGFFRMLRLLRSSACLPLSGRVSTCPRFRLHSSPTTSTIWPTRVRFTLRSDQFALLNPNTFNCPVFRTRHDADLTISIYKRVPIFLRRGDEGLHEQSMERSLPSHVRHVRRFRPLRNERGA